MDVQGYLKTTDLFWGHKVIKKKTKTSIQSFHYHPLEGYLFIFILFIYCDLFKKCMYYVNKMYYQATVNSLTFKYSFFCGTASNYHTIAKLWTRISPDPVFFFFF